ncbi:MAG: DUF4105 domain-containing protein [Myxococcota bacterium]
MHVNQTHTFSALLKWGFLTLTMVSVLGMAAPADAAQPPWASGQSNPEDLQIKLVTFGVGDRVVEWFGHTALVVEDTKLDRARLYNYGMFSFDSTMLMKFAMGRLWFWVGQAPAEPTYKLYERYGRDVRIIDLNLPPEKRQEVANFLAKDVLPENRDYLYHHYDDNCSTRIRDIVDLGVDGRLEEVSSKPSPRTLRDLTRIHSHHNPPMQMLLMFLMNDSIDKQITYWDEMFLPIRLENWVKELEYENKDGEMVPLAGEERVFYDSGRPPLPDEPLTRWPYWLVVGVVLGGLALLAGRRRQSNPEDRGARIGHGLMQTLVGLSIGVLGLGLFVMASFTDHQVTYWNENLFLSNPLTFLALPLGLMVTFGSERAERWLPKVWYVCAALAVLLLPLKLLPSFDQGNLLPIVFMLPVVLGAAGGAHLASTPEHAAPDSAPAEDED